ncbi:MAG: DUF4410 domain-containing protein [Acinetobacter sp.]|nr:DUF4410 domain-containing protein [Acinetobacter sp.]
MKSISLALVTSAILALSACTTVNSVSNIPKQVQKSYSAFQLQDISTQKSDINSQFAKKLNEQLTKYGYKTGNGLNLSYNIESFDAGNRALRYFVGFGAGKATATISVKLTDETGQNLGQVSTDTALYIGAFGGDAKGIIDKAAKDIAKKIHETGILQK